ncbi:MAG: hypothetical protein AAF483_23350 [Planctomycetota bacterium]
MRITKSCSIVLLVLVSFMCPLLAQQEPPQNPPPIKPDRKTQDTIINRLKKLVEIPVSAFRSEYIAVRDDFIEAERKLRWGNMTFTSKEQKVEAYFDNVRKMYVAQFQGIKTVDGKDITKRSQFDFPPSKPFPMVKDEIAATDSFKLIQEMPKGGILHVHSSVVGSAEWIVGRMGDFDNCYVYWPTDLSKWGRGKIELWNSDKVKQYAADIGSYQRGLETIAQIKQEIARQATPERQEPLKELLKGLEGVAAADIKVPMSR